MFWFYFLFCVDETNAYKISARRTLSLTNAYVPPPVYGWKTISSNLFFYNTAQKFSTVVTQNWSGKSRTKRPEGTSEQASPWEASSWTGLGMNGPRLRHIDKTNGLEPVRHKDTPDQPTQTHMGHIFPCPGNIPQRKAQLFP